MITIPAGMRVYLAMGPTDMRKGFDGLSLLAQEVLKLDPFSGYLFVFRGKRGDLLKVLYWDGQGFPVCQAAREGLLRVAGDVLRARLRHDGMSYVRASGTTEGSVTLTPAQLSMLLEGIDWRAPQRTWQPTVAG